jgi:hypothetical protein
MTIHIELLEIDLLFDNAASQLQATPQNLAT